MFNKGDIVRIKENLNYAAWYTPKNLMILGKSEEDEDCYFVNHTFNQYNNAIHENKLYLIESAYERRQKKLNSL